MLQKRYEEKTWTKKEELALKIKQRIDRLCYEHHLGIGELADMADVSKTQMNEYGQKGVIPSLYNLAKICEALDITLTEFFLPLDDASKKCEIEVALLQEQKRLVEQNQALLRLRNRLDLDKGSFKKKRCSLTLDEAWDYAEKQMRLSPKLSKETVGHYRQLYLSKISPEFGERNVSEIKETDYQRFLENEKVSLKPRSINVIMVILSWIYKELSEIYELENPIKSIKNSDARLKE